MVLISTDATYYTSSINQKLVNMLPPPTTGGKRGVVGFWAESIF